MTDQNKQREIVVLLGKNGFGKSHFAKNYLIPNLPGPVFIVDPMAEYEGTVWDSFTGFFNHVRKNKYIPDKKPNVFRVKSDNEARKVFRFADGLKQKISLVVEEADKYQAANRVDETLYSMAHYGRHYSQNLVFIARRAASLSRDITSQSTVICTFAQHEKIDLRALANFTDKTEVIKELKKQEFLTFGFSEKNKTFPDLIPDSVSKLNGKKIIKV